MNYRIICTRPLLFRVQWLWKMHKWLPAKFNFDCATIADVNTYIQIFTNKYHCECAVTRA